MCRGKHSRRRTLLEMECHVGPTPHDGLWFTILVMALIIVTTVIGCVILSQGGPEYAPW